MLPTEAKRVAIIGGGCAGVTSFWALQRSTHDVHLFEASSTLGGRIRTVPFEYDETYASVDTGSSCFNVETSPNFVSLLRNLGIPTSPIPFTFGASDGAEVYEWKRSTWGDVVRPWSLCSLDTCRILFDIIRFKYLILDVLMERRSSSNTCSTNAYEYLTNEGFSVSFQDKYLAPLLSALWGTNAGRSLPQISMKALACFVYDHQLHNILKTTLRWRRMDMSASQFIQQMAAGFPPNKVYTRTKVQEIKRIGKKGYTLVMPNGEEMNFDHVIFAVGSQEALHLLKPTIRTEETQVLQEMRTTRNIAVLHSDFLLMPNAQTSPPYNYILSSSSNMNSPSHRPPNASLTYNINTLQEIPSAVAGPIAITVNPFTPPHPRLVQAVWEFTDMEIGNTALDTQRRRLPTIQNRDGLSYCFVWTGRGFFEDAVTGALRVAVEHLGAEVPFQVDVQHRDFHGGGDGEAIGSMVLGVRDHLVLTSLGLVRVYLRAFELLLALLDLFWVWILTRRGRYQKIR